MKNIILSTLILSTLSIISCKDFTKSDATDETRTSSKTSEEITEVTVEALDGVPIFTDALAQTFANNISLCYEDYEKALKNEDVRALNKVVSKLFELSKFNATISEEDEERILEYMTSKENEIEELYKISME